MLMLPANTPLYSHPLPQIEEWLKNQGCQQDRNELHCWHITKPTWKAELWLDVEQITVRYFQAGQNNQDIQRSFKYSLTRKDIEQAIFAGP
nr:DUF3143 domain-containing protein [Anabaena sp. FACHB-1237]